MSSARELRRHSELETPDADDSFPDRSGAVVESPLRRLIPIATNGTASTNQRAAQLKGRIPSEMCMAWAGEAIKIEKALQRHRGTEENLFLLYGSIGIGTGKSC